MKLYFHTATYQFHNTSHLILSLLSHHFMIFQPLTEYKRKATGEKCRSYNINIIR